MLHMRVPCQLQRLVLAVAVPTMTAAATACAPAAAPGGADTASATAALAAADSMTSQLVAAALRSDVSGLLDGFSEDYLSLETAGQAVPKPAYRTFLDTLTANGRLTQLVYEPLGSHVSGDIVVRYGHIRMAYEPKTGQPWDTRGNYMHVFRRQADGSWKLATEIANTVAPLPPIAPPGGGASPK